MRFLEYLRELLYHVVSPWYYRQERLAESRRPYTKGEFIDYFSTLGVDTQITSEVWDFFKESSEFDEFTPYPEDNIVEVYGLADDELDDPVLGILQRCQCKIPPPTETAEMPPVETVAELVMFVSQMKAEAAAKDSE